jgi:hypothetical protein
MRVLFPACYAAVIATLFLYPENVNVTRFGVHHLTATLARLWMQIRFVHGEDIVPRVRLVDLHNWLLVRESQFVLHRTILPRVFDRVFPISGHPTAKRDGEVRNCRAVRTVARQLRDSQVKQNVAAVNAVAVQE